MSCLPDGHNSNIYYQRVARVNTDTRVLVLHYSTFSPHFLPSFRTEVRPTFPPSYFGTDKKRKEAHWERKVSARESAPDLVD
jgi:hypothetical protein